MAYSQGFHPHMQLSFALPLPLGMVGTRDYADITLESNMPEKEIISRFNANAPGGLLLHGAWEFTGPGAAALVSVADYMFSMSLKKWDEIFEIEEKIIQPIMAQESIIIPKKTKSGIKDTDIRPDIISITAEDCTLGGIDLKEHSACILMRLAAGSGRFLNPTIVAKLLTGREIDPSSIVRHDLYRQDKEKGLVPLYEAPIY